MPKVKIKKRYIALVGIIFFIIFYAYMAMQPGKYNSFAQCLTDKGVSMGGTDWCHFCQKQKSLFGKSFKFVDYHNCDKEKFWCDSNGVQGYPTWILPDGETYSGVHTLKELSSLSGCSLE